MRYTTAGEIDYNYFDPDGRRVDSAATVEVKRIAGMFGEAVVRLVLKETGREYGNPDVLMTTEAHWSGYSEFTITNQWSQIVLSVPAWNWEREWPSLGDFLRAMADANPEADR